MGSKNSKNAQNALDGANNQPLLNAPSKDEDATVDCKNKHWIAVRVEFEDGTLVETGIQKKLQLNNGETRDVTLSQGAQPGGEYAVGKIMDATDNCQISFPTMYDAEIKPK
jgi:hypothetical protein